MGYEPQDVSISGESYQELTIYLVPEENTIEAVQIKAPKRSKYSNKNNPAVELIRQVIAHKDENRIAAYDYAQYQQYEKVSLGLSNLSEKFKNRKVFKNYQFLFEKEDVEGSDASGDTPYRPLLKNVFRKYTVAKSLVPQNSLYLLNNGHNSTQSLSIMTV